MQSIENKTITIDGAPINILMAGDFSTTPFLFLHGKAFQAETWKELGTLQAAIEAGYSILALDLPGFGKSPESSVSPEAIINGVMEVTGIKSVFLIAPSMSGRIGIEFSLANPEKISGLVLIGAVGVAENRDQLHNLPTKTLIIWGEIDQISDPSNAQLLHEKIRGSELVIFPGAKHPCYLEQPEFWHQTLLSFAKNIANSK